MMAISFLTVGHAADDQADKNQSDKNAEVAKLKAQLEQQQKQIEQLSKSLADQQKLIQKVVAASDAAPAPPAESHMLPNLGEVASTTPVLPPPAPSAPVPALNPPQAAAGNAPPAPLQLQLGNITITPIGFLDAAGVWRNKATGSGIGSNFGSIPFDNAVPGGKLGEFRFSPQNSRIGFRIDGNWKGVKFLNYLETDFLGTSGSNYLGVTNGAFVPRLRLYWVDSARADRISRRPELELDDAQPKRHLRRAGRHLL